MTVSTLCSHILSKNEYNVAIYKGYSIGSVDYELWSGRDNDIPIGLIGKEVVDWAVNWSPVILTIVVFRD